MPMTTDNISGPFEQEQRIFLDGDGTHAAAQTVPVITAPLEPAPLETALLDQQLSEHEKQHTELTENLKALDLDYEQKRKWASTALDQLSGAILALRGLKEAAQKKFETYRFPGE